MPITPPGPASSTARIILSNGDRFADGIVIGNIEDASLYAGTAAVLITIAESGRTGALLIREPDGTVTTAFDGRQPDDIDGTTLSRVRAAPTGEIVFQSGRGLDSDRLHLLADGVIQTIAGAEPGPVFPDFRILGNVRIGTGGVVAFVGGGGPCEVQVGDEQPRVSCTNALYVADTGGVTRLDDEELELERQRPTAVRVEIDPNGGAWFSLPRRGNAPMLLHHRDGVTDVVLTASSELPGVGLLNALEAVAINASGDILIEATQRELVGERRPHVIGVLRGDSFSLLAKEGTELGGQTVATLRGLAIDGAGRALFEAGLVPPGDPSATPRASLWYGDASGLVEIVREGEPFPGEGAIVLDLQASRLNDAGDIAFTTRLGSADGGTARVEEVRATVRRANGDLVTVASSRHTGQLGTISSLQIVGFDAEGTLLLIAARGASSDRVLLLGRSDGREG